MLIMDTIASDLSLIKWSRLNGDLNPGPSDQESDDEGVGRRTELLITLDRVSKKTGILDFGFASALSREQRQEELQVFFSHYIPNAGGDRDQICTHTKKNSPFKLTWFKLFYLVLHFSPSLSGGHLGRQCLQAKKTQNKNSSMGAVRPITSTCLPFCPFSNTTALYMNKSITYIYHLYLFVVVLF